jgi:hypothetical protein
MIDALGIAIILASILVCIFFAVSIFPKGDSPSKEEYSDLTPKKDFYVMIYSYNPNFRSGKIGVRITAKGMVHPRSCERYILYDPDKFIGSPVVKTILSPGDIIEACFYDTATHNKISHLEYTMRQEDMKDGTLYVLDGTILPKHRVTSNFGVRFVGHRGAHGPPYREWPMTISDVYVYSGDNMIASYSVNLLPQNPERMVMGNIAWEGQIIRVTDQNNNPIGVGQMVISNVNAQYILVVGRDHISFSTS